MVTSPTKPSLAAGSGLPGGPLPSWPSDRSAFAPVPHDGANRTAHEGRPFGGDALQALLAFSALHQQVRKRRALASRQGFEIVSPSADFEREEQFVLDEVLQLVAERAVSITGADGFGIALAENNEIVLRASAGVIKPDVGARIERDSAFSGACFRSATIIRCDDTETDDRVNLYACRQLGARSMVAVPLCGRRRVIGLLEAFSAEPFGFNDSDVASLELLAELILGAVKPEDEDRFAESAQVAETELAAPTPSAPESVASLSAEIAADAFVDSATTLKQPASAVEPKSAEPSMQKSSDVSGAIEAGMDSAAIDSVAIDSKTISSGLIDLKASLPELDPAETEKSADTPIFELAIKPAATSRNPGVLLVFALVVVAALSAGGLWWKLKNAQLEKAIVRPVQQVEEPAPPKGKSSAPTAAAPGTTLNAQTAARNLTAGNELNSSQSADNENSAAKDGSKTPGITGIRHWSAADSSTVVLDLEDQVQYEAHRLANPDRIYFDLHDTSLAPDLEGKTIEIGDGLLTRIRVAQPAPGLTRVVLETKGNSNYSVSLEPNPYRLVVQVRKIGAEIKAQVSLFPGAAEDRGKLFAIVVPPPTHEDIALRAHVPKMRIVVDAGHGGWDLGTVGRRGLLEKDLVLEIAQRLGKLLETRLGAEVILTRNDDNYIPLDERAGMANHSQADLFVSVHANYSDLPSARGVETYYTNFFSAPGAKELETGDVSSLQIDRTKSAPAAVLSPGELHDRIEQSRRLAASVQRSLYGTLSAQNPGLRDRGVKEASYVVLTETAMPGILAEVSFVSSPTDEQKLRSDGYREQIAEALYKGIARYAANSRGVKMASAAK